MSGSRDRPQDAPQRVGPYEIERPLGRGGMAAVYVARDAKHNRSVALKLFSAEASSLADAERFAREIRLASQLQHPHLCAIYDSGESDGRLWFTMPLVAGASLRERLDREPRPPHALVRRIIREAASGLQAAHRAGIVHRDVKPENLLLTSDEATLVADFGIARAAAADGAATPALTGTGLLLGTPAYMSPEQLEGRSDIGPACDQYALAMVAYEMLAGRHPDVRESGRRQPFTRLVEGFDPIPDLPPQLAQGVNAVLARALHKEPAQRYDSIAGFAQALESAMTAPAQASAPGQGSPRPSRRPALLAALAIIAVISLGGVAYWMAQRGGTSTELPRLAVLAFENVGDPGDSTFTGGVGDAVRERLASLTNVEVMTRGASVAAGVREQDPATIARRLELDYLLTGTVRWSQRDSQVVITPELVRIGRRGPSVLWTERIVGRTENVFSLQEAVAARVARAMNATLEGTTDDALARGTRNLDAHEAFLEGERASLYGSVADRGMLQRADSIYSRSVALDPRYGLAWSRLAWARAYSYTMYGGGPERRDLVAATVDSAKRYAANEPYTSLAESFFVSSTVGPREAIPLTRAATERHRSSALLLAQMATLYQRSGKLDSAQIYLRRGLRLDPNDPTVLLRAAMIFNVTRQYPASDSVSSRGLAVSRGNTGLHLHRIQAALGAGDSAEARRRVLVAYGEAGARGTTVIARMLDSYPIAWVVPRPLLDEILAADSTAFSSADSRRLIRAQAFAVLGDSAAMRREAQAAAENQRRLRLRYERRNAAAGLGAEGNALASAGLLESIAVAMLGDCAPIRAHAQLVDARGPGERDYVSYGYAQYSVARALTACGDHEAAIARLESLLAQPASYSRAWLALDPTFAPLRTHPRFPELIATQ